MSVLKVLMKQMLMACQGCLSAAFNPSSLDTAGKGSLQPVYVAYKLSKPLMGFQTRSLMAHNGCLQLKATYS